MSMTVREAVIEVLREASQPLSTQEVTDAVLRSKKVNAHGKTPRETIKSAVYVLSQAADNPGVQRLAEPGHAAAPRRPRDSSLRQLPQ